MSTGGATAAVNAQVPERNFKRHGRWKSENVKDNYVKDRLESRLKVLRNFGLYLKSCYSLLCASMHIANQPLW